MSAKPLDVLLVEDDPGDVDLTREALTDGNGRVSLHVVEDGVKAIEYLHREGSFADVKQPDLILLDLNLPKKDGREVLKEIKSDEKLKAIPVIVLTTSDSESDISKTYQDGANSYVTKPIGFDKFKKVIKSIEDFWFGAVKFAAPPEEWGEKVIRILMVEDDPGDVDLLWELLSEETSPSFEIECANTLEKGIGLLAQGNIDVVLLDLFLSDGRGIETLAKMQTHAQKTPVVIMTGLDDEMIALEAVRNGAQDYLVKGQTSSKMFSRVIRYAIARHKMQTALQGLSLLDELTGIYNRRGFMNLADQHLKLAMRTKKELVLIIADLDGLKRINDAFGHQEGDLALIKAGQLLRSTFRESDVVARIGGDEFAVLALDVMDGDDEIICRLQEHIKDFNQRRNRRCPIVFSFGAVRFDPRRPYSLEDIMSKADEALYQNKRSKTRESS